MLSGRRGCKTCSWRSVLWVMEQRVESRGVQHVSSQKNPYLEEKSQVSKYKGHSYFQRFRFFANEKDS